MSGLLRGARGGAVVEAQEHLRRLGYPLPRSTRPDGTLDGIYGGELERTKAIFEGDRPLPDSPSGSIRQGTLAALRAAKPYLRGVDASHHNKVTWAEVAAGGYRFAYLKASEGQGYEDPEFREHYAAAKAAGLRVGGYHFFRWNRTGRVQAENLLRRLSAVGGLCPGALPPSLDIEEEPPPDFAPSARNAALQEAIDTIHRETGRYPLIYTSARVYTRDRLYVGGECPLWVVWWSSKSPAPHAPRLPAPWKDWTLWQTSDEPGIPGFGGADGDHDLFNGGEAELREFCL